ncbi:MAG: hypothetical protein O7F76_03785 [Planctomycetota bacterium]|nr:hypothetical protein [Planctomycetota bacterium]
MITVPICISMAISFGCTRGKPAAQAPDTTRAQSISALYDRVETVFANAAYFKPRSENPRDRAEELPPLILQDLESAADGADAIRGFGVLAIDKLGNLNIDASQPTVYTAGGFVHLNGREYEQTLHIWWYAVSPRTSAAGTVWQGFRTTLGSDGFPIIWEVVSNSDSAAQIFVSESLEKACIAAFGEPLPGRRFSIERSLADQPRVVVSRVLADGPVPMGPWIYLRASDRAVSTIICRCMPSQVEDISQTAYYEMAPLSTLAELQMDAGAREVIPAGPDELNHGVPDMADPSWLEDALRLPPEF